MLRWSGWKLRTMGAVSVLAVLLATDARGQVDYVWTGAISNDVLNLLNWQGFTPPMPGVDLGQADLVFAGDNLLPPIGANLPHIGANNYQNVGFIRFDASVIPVDFGIQAAGGSFIFADGGGIIDNSLIGHYVEGNLIGTGDQMVILVEGSVDVRGNVILSDTMGVQLVVGGAGSTIVSGNISGTDGTLLKQDAGTLILTGVNTYTGGTELAEGALFIGGNSALGTGMLFVTGNSGLGASGAASAANDIFLDAVLTIQGTDNLTLDGNIEGSGSLVIDFGADNDLLTLSGNNTYSGGTTLTQGTLILGSDMALGTGALTVAGTSNLGANATRTLGNVISIDSSTILTIMGANDLVLAGDISGEGVLEMDFDADGDTLTLGGNNAYTGGTTLTQGTLLLASDTALGDAAGAVTVESNVTIQSAADLAVDNDFVISNVSALTFSGSHGLTLNGAISGLAGSMLVDLDAGNTLLLTGYSTYTGPTTVNGGELRLEGASLLSPVTVNSGAAVSGTGFLTDLTIASGGVLRVDIDGDTGTADLLDLTGAAVLDAGSVITASLTSTGYVPTGETFDILHAAGGITDNGAIINTTSATLTVSLIRDLDFSNGNTSYALELSRASDAYSSPFLLGNTRTIGLSLDSLIPVANSEPTGPAGVLLSMLDGRDDLGYEAAVSQLSPEPHNASTGIWRNETREFMRQQTGYLASVRHAGGADRSPMPTPPAVSMALANDDPLVLAGTMAQVAEAPVPRGYAWEDGWGGYAEAQGSFVDSDQTSNRTGYNANPVGAQFGLDYTFGRDLLVGLGLGYVWTEADLAGARGEIDQGTVRVGPYLSWFEHDWYVNMSATFGYSWIEGERGIPALGLTAASDYDAYDFTGYVGTGYQLQLEEHFYLTPMASLQFSHIEFDSFAEAGAGVANLSVPGRDDDSLRSRLGANLSYRFPDLATQPITYVYAGWEHEFEEDNDLEASFRAGGDPFVIDTGSRDSDALFVGAGVEALVYETMAAYFRVEYVESENSDALGIAGALVFGF